MREAQDAYRRATVKAWEEIERRLQELTASAPGKRFKLVEISYDPMPGQSIIEELPEQPKSSRPQAVDVSVRLRATYAVR